MRGGCRQVALLISAWTTVKKFAFTASGIVFAAVLGIACGAATYTFYYGEGHSYFNKAPETCINCHIMQPQYDTWLKSSHHAVARCVDCHLPHEFPYNFISKTDNGWNHSWAFTFQNFHEPIRMKPRNRRILEHNCRSCHEAMVHQMLSYNKASLEADEVSCLHCHADVGHTYPPR
jgi:cytochrome c nitrite reductase small subunit